MVRERGLGEYDVVRLVTWLRRRAASGAAPAETIALVAESASGPAPWDGDENLSPVDPEDPLLSHDVGTADFDAGGAGMPATSTGQGTGTDLAANPAATSARLAALEQENEGLREALRAVTTTAARVAAGGDGDDNGDDAGPAPTAPAPPPFGATGATVPSDATANPAATPAALLAARRVDRAYFGGYAGLAIHREMLDDDVRTEAYRKALEDNPSLVKGATVLDVGCGTGVLSLFAARGGAARVVGVDGSKRIAGLAARVAAANGRHRSQGGERGVMSVVPGAIEDLCVRGGGELPPDGGDDADAGDGSAAARLGTDGAAPGDDARASTLDHAAGPGVLAGDVGPGQVDVLVSEWMGYALLFETMLPSVLRARDRYLKPGGAVLPDRCVLRCSLATRAATGVTFWESVYGLSMAPVRDALMRDASLREAIVREVDPEALCSDEADLLSLDLTTCTERDLDFTRPFDLEVTAPSTAESPSPAAPAVAALVVWFDCTFSDRFCKESPVVLSTSPKTKATHWVQTVLALRTPLNVPAGGRVRGTVSFARSRSEHRKLDLAVTAEAVGLDGALLAGQSVTQSWTMSVS